jgi:uncharacterized protein
MEAIYIPRLVQAPERSTTIEFKEILPNLPTLTPVQGVLKVTHQGNYLEISAQAETIVTLMCHRCLQQFNHRLSVSVSEMLWLTEKEKEEQVEELPLDRDLSMDDLIETLPPNGYFEPSVWLYEQLCLEIPQRQICSQDCEGIEVKTSDSKPAIDQRWASLESLKGQLPS